MNFLQRNPFFRLLLPLIIGIVSFQLIQINAAISILFWSVALLLIISPLLIKNSNIQYKYRWLFGAGIFIFLFQLAFFLTDQKEKASDFKPLGQKGIFEIEILESPIIKENSILCRIRIVSVFDSLERQQPAHGKAILYIAKDSTSKSLESADKLLIETIFKKPDGVINPNGFDYATYLKRQGIGATAYISNDRWIKTGSNEGFSIFRLAEKSQHKLLEIYHRFGISGDEFAVLAALTLGSKDALHPELRQNYTTSGGMHILAVSGLHVGVIYLVLNFLLQFFDRKQKYKFLKALTIVFLLWVYAFITGLPPSVIRSTLMFSLVALGTGLERKPQIFNTISMAAFIMLLINPNFLFDVGFQLSFSAVISIVYFQPKIAKWFVFKNKALRWVWDLTAVSLAAQIGTAPFSIYYFHQFPNYFLVTNFIAIPFATFIIYTAVALFILSPVPYLSSIIAYFLNKMLQILNFSIASIHHLPLSLTITSINGWQLALAFAVIILFTFYLHNKQFKPLILSLFIAFAFVGIDVYQQFKAMDTVQVVVFSDNKDTHISFIDHKNNSVFTTDSSSLHRLIDNFILQNKLNAPENINKNYWYNDGYAIFHGIRFMILTSNELKGKTSIQKLPVDYLIIGNRQKPKITQLLDCVIPREIIVDKSISEWYKRDIRKVCEAKNIAFYSVAERGAFILDLKE